MWGPCLAEITADFTIKADTLVWGCACGGLGCSHFCPGTWLTIQFQTQMAWIPSSIPSLTRGLIHSDPAKTS